MRKINIGFISPYEAMVPLIDELKEEQPDLSIEAKVGNLEQGIETALEMEREGADILISRGGTAKMIRESVSLPVIDVHISGYDLLRSITLATGHSAEKKALVGFSNITMGAASIVSLLEIDLEVVTLSSASEVDEVLAQLKGRGFTRILGDVITVDAAANLGLNGLLIQSGRESLVESFGEARHMFKSLQKNQQQLRAVGQLMGNWEKDVVILQENGQILLEKFSSFDHSPLAENSLMEVHKQVQTSKEPIVILEKDGAIPFYAKAEMIEDRDGPMTAFLFDRRLFNPQVSGAIEVERVLNIPPLVAESPQMKSIKRLLEEPAILDEPVILIGMEGTGKKTVAQYMHAFHAKPGLFVQLKMEELGESFDGAGVYDNSTVLLSYRDVPSTESIVKAKRLIKSIEGKGVQIVFSMPAYWSQVMEELELEQAVKVQLPPLAERKEDILYLVRQFLMEYHQNLGTQPVKVRDDAMQVLTEYNWPGNLNELKEYMKKAASIEKDYVIEKSTLEQLPFPSSKAEIESGFELNRQDSLKEIERKIIGQVLVEENYNQTKAAKRLGINRATLWRKLKT